MKHLDESHDYVFNHISHKNNEDGYMTITKKRVL